jgi:hypothetical protein
MTQTPLSRSYQIPLAGVRRLLFRAVGATGLSLLAGFFALWYAVRSENDPTSLRFSYGTTTLLAIALGIPALLKFRNKLKSFRLVLQEDSILRCQDGWPDVLVKRNEIVRVEEKSSFGLTIRVKGRDKVLRIPAEVAGYLEIRDHLASWGPVVRKFFGGIYSVMFALIPTTAVMALLFGSQNSWFVFPTSAALLVCLVVAAMKTQQDPGTDRYSRLVVCGLVLVAALVLTFKVVLTLGYRK